MKNLKIKIIFLTIFLIVFLSLFQNAYASNEPVLLFSDMTDAPTTGWEQSTVKGAAVSIWGRNFGNSRGNSYITVGGVNLTNDSDYAEWGVTTNPTVPLGMQRITFWLNSDMQTGAGTIKVTTDNGESNKIPFYCRALEGNHIYFFATNGNDNNSGLTTTSPKKNPYWCRTGMVAGDIAYFRTGTWLTEYDPTAPNSYPVFNFSDTGSTWSNGTIYNAKTFKAYPGEVPVFGNGNVENGNIQTFIRQYTQTPSHLNYWTFSCLTMNMEVGIWNPNSQLGYEYNDNIRFIGNDMTAVRTTASTGFGLNVYGNLTNWYILGNYFHNFGQGAGVLYKAEPIYIAGSIVNGSTSNNVNIAWNHFYHNDGHIIQVFGHNPYDTIDNLYIHDNFLDTNYYAGSSGLNFGGDSNNPSGVHYHYVQNLYFYNNIVARMRGNALRVPDDGSMGSYGGNYYLYNNTFYENSSDGGPSFLSTNPDSLVLRNNIIYTTSDGLEYWDSIGAIHIGNGGINSAGDHNCWYGKTTIPSWSTTGDLNNINPQFKNSNPQMYNDFKLLQESPVTNTGSALVSSIAPKDFLGVIRPQGLGYDIGAFEYEEGGTADTTAPNAPGGLSVR